MHTVWEHLEGTRRSEKPVPNKDVLWARELRDGNRLLSRKEYYVYLQYTQKAAHE